MVKPDSATMIHVGRTKTKPDQNRSFHNSVNFLVKFANGLGLLPVSGLRSVSEMGFKWKSWKVMHSALTMLVFVLITLICIVKWTSSKFSFKLVVRQLNQINAFSSLVLYFCLAKKWPKFVRLWTEMDKKMDPVYGYPKDLDFRIRLATFITLICAIGEYILLFVYQIVRLNRQKGEVDVENYFLFIFPELFSVLPFNGIFAFFAMLTTFIGHMIWSFNDLFIVVLSTALALRFKQIATRLHLDEKKANSNNYWTEIRADYERLVQLSRKLEKYISYIVLLSYSANVFFLLIQLSNVIGHLNYHVQILYYIYSFSFLIARLAAVSLYGAWIMDESKEPANSLHSVPSATYNMEIRRLLLQISFSDVAITGSKMFKVTRGLILNVAGAIVTYELVIIQFSSSEGIQVSDK